MVQLWTVDRLFAVALAIQRHEVAKLASFANEAVIDPAKVAGAIVNFFLGNLSSSQIYLPAMQA